MRPEQDPAPRPPRKLVIEVRRAVAEALAGVDADAAMRMNVVRSQSLREHARLMEELQAAVHAALDEIREQLRAAAPADSDAEDGPDASAARQLLERLAAESTFHELLERLDRLDRPDSSGD
jgi:hypothetical protein